MVQLKSNTVSHCSKNKNITMLSFLNRRQKGETGEAAQPSISSTAEDMSASAYASKNFSAIIKENKPKDWTLGGFLILCVDSLSTPTEEVIQWMIEIVNRCNLECKYAAIICESKPGVVMVGSSNAGIMDSANFGLYVTKKGFKKPRANKNIYVADDYTAKMQMKSMPPKSGLPPSYSPPDPGVLPPDTRGEYDALYTTLANRVGLSTKYNT